MLYIYIFIALISDLISKISIIYLSRLSRLRIQQKKLRPKLAEMFGYSTDLRSKTQGRASFTMNFLKYEEIPYELSKVLLEKKGIMI